MADEKPVFMMEVLLCVGRQNEEGTYRIVKTFMREVAVDWTPASLPLPSKRYAPISNRGARPSSRARVSCNTQGETIPPSFGNHHLARA